MKRRRRLPRFERWRDERPDGSRFAVAWRMGARVRVGRFWYAVIWWPLTHGVER